MNTTNLKNQTNQAQAEQIILEEQSFRPKGRFYLLTLLLVIFYITIAATVFGATIYIDPSYSGSTQNGSMSNPYNSWSKVTISSGNTYLQKAGTTFNTSGGLTINGKTGVTIGSYGSGNKPRIVSSGSSNHIINISSSSGVTVKDIEITSTGNSTTGVIIQGTNAGNNTINNTLIHKVGWGVRIITTSGGNKILKSTIHDTKDDGIYIKDASSIEIGFCTIYDVNKKYLQNTDESYSSGDGIQMASTNNLVFNIHDNIIDHSSMGNKFCIIAWGNNYSGTIERNTIIGAVNKNTSGIYLSPTTKTVTVRYNSIRSGEYGIYSYAKTDAYYNVFSNNKVGVHTMQNYSYTSRNNVYYNNSTIGVSSASSTSLNLKNNIFYISGSAKAIKYSGSISSNNNVFNSAQSGFINSYSSITAWRNASNNDRNSVVGNPAFVNPSNNDFHLQSSSVAINKGVNVSLVKDFFGGTVPMSGAPDAGIHEYNGTKSGQMIAEGDSLIQMLEGEMTVYPNPSIDGRFAIKLGKLYEKTDIEVFDVTGRIVKKTTATMTAEPTLDMTTAPNGAYLIRVDTGGEKKVLKAIKNE